MSALRRTVITVRLKPDTTFEKTDSRSKTHLTHPTYLPHLPYLPYLPHLPHLPYSMTGRVSPGSSSSRCAHHGAMPLVITRS